MPKPPPPLARLDAEVKDGLASQRARWVEAERQLRYYDLRATDLIRPRPLETAGDFERRPKLAWRLTRRVIRELAKGLYANPPRRTLEGGGEASTFYDRVVAGNDLDALMLTSDRYAWLHGVFAIQVGPTGDPERPIRLDPWGADEFAVWLSDDDPREPWAVCVKSLFAARRQVRYQLWSATEVRTFWTEPGDTQVSCETTPGGRTLIYDASRSMPHGLGCLPFVFVHNEPPVKSFWVEGLGRCLADVDAVITDQLSDLAQAIQVHCIPPGFVENVASANPFVHRGAGGFIEVIRQTKDQEARIFYVQPQLMVAEVWMHALHYSNQALQDLDLPLIANLESLSSPESGVAIAARRMPLIDLWRARQKPFGAVEDELKTVVLTVAGNALGRRELAAAAARELRAIYPEPQLPLPTPERDDADERAVTWGIKSRVMMIQERYGMTRDAAIEHLRQVEEDRRDEERILGPADRTDPGERSSDQNDSDADPENPPPGEDDGQDPNNGRPESAQ